MHELGLCLTLSLLHMDAGERALRGWREFSRPVNLNEDDMAPWGALRCFQGCCTMLLLFGVQV